MTVSTAGAWSRVMVNTSGSPLFSATLVGLTLMLAPGTPALPPSPSVVLSDGSGSGTSGEDTVAPLVKAPGASMVAVTVMVAVPLASSEAMVHGIVVHAPLTLVIVRLVGTSVTCTLVAADGPALPTSMV